MNHKNEEFKKIFVSIYFVFKTILGIFKKENQRIAKSILTFIYRQYIFNIPNGIKPISFFDYLKLNNFNFEYNTYNFYQNNIVWNKASSMGTEESQQLACLVRLINPNSILEFGTNNGGTTYNLSLNTKENCAITTVDLNPVNFQNIVIKAFFEQVKVNTITTDTKYLYEKIKNVKYDFILIDAGHTYQEIKNDTEIALKVLSPSGMIVWHDYNRLEPDVVKYLNELSKKLSLIHLELGTLVVYQS